MSNPETNPPGSTDTELTPEAMAMLGKARRSFAVSMGILLLGFMAIGVALVYRVMRDSPPPSVAESVAVPQGAEVISAINTDGTIQVTFSAGGATLLNIYDAGTGELERSVTIGVE
ncbi:DUF6476 family protein [Devosia sediminis]|uniref:Fimbrial protein n=1 Tax=Devosia sediminis TaxID=2798801 RepID=A0A934IYW1_9HYPH|nr:DUF6476 family protein [Devosia sediminis]MBJ3786967.1 hypothetical protein [Devosia sediminis]